MCNDPDCQRDHSNVNTAHPFLDFDRNADDGNEPEPYDPSQPPIDSHRHPSPPGASLVAGTQPAYMTPPSRCIINTLPSGILYNILRKVARQSKQSCTCHPSAPSLPRCTLVCKHWYRHAQNMQFIHIFIDCAEVNTMAQRTNALDLLLLFLNNIRLGLGPRTADGGPGRLPEAVGFVSWSNQTYGSEENQAVMIHAKPLIVGHGKKNEKFQYDLKKEVKEAIWAVVDSDPKGKVRDGVRVRSLEARSLVPKSGCTVLKGIGANKLKKRWFEDVVAGDMNAINGLLLSMMPSLMNMREYACLVFDQAEKPGKIDYVNYVVRLARYLYDEEYAESPETSGLAANLENLSVTGPESVADSEAFAAVPAPKKQLTYSPFGTLSVFESGLHGKNAQAVLPLLALPSLETVQLAICTSDPDRNWHLTSASSSQPPSNITTAKISIESACMRPIDAGTANVCFLLSHLPKLSKLELRDTDIWNMYQYLDFKEILRVFISKCPAVKELVIASKMDPKLGASQWNQLRSMHTITRLQVNTTLFFDYTLDAVPKHNLLKRLPKALQDLELCFDSHSLRHWNPMGTFSAASFANEAGIWRAIHKFLRSMGQNNEPILRKLTVRTPIYEEVLSLWVKEKIKLPDSTILAWRSALDERDRVRAMVSEWRTKEINFVSKVQSVYNANCGDASNEAAHESDEWMSLNEKMTEVLEADVPDVPPTVLAFKILAAEGVLDSVRRVREQMGVGPLPVFEGKELVLSKIMGDEVLALPGVLKRLKRAEEGGRVSGVGLGEGNGKGGTVNELLSEERQ